jgi:hypothetical protein
VGGTVQYPDDPWLLFRVSGIPYLRKTRVELVETSKAPRVDRLDPGIENRN